MAGDVDGFCDLAVQSYPQGPIGFMESPIGSLVTHCDMFAKSSILVETLEMRGVLKAQREEATYPRSHS